jgi:hypothetical protein
MEVTNDFQFQDWVVNGSVVNEEDGRFFSSKREAPSSNFRSCWPISGFERASVHHHSGHPEFRSSRRPAHESASVAHHSGSPTFWFSNCHHVAYGGRPRSAIDGVSMRHAQLEGMAEGGNGLGRNIRRSRLSERTCRTFDIGLKPFGAGAGTHRRGAEIGPDVNSAG